MPTLSVNGIDITYIEESINNNTSYRLSIVGFGGMSATPEYGGQKTLSLKCDGKTFISNTASFPSNTKPADIHEYLEATELKTARDFAAMYPSNSEVPQSLQKQWNKGTVARNYTLTLSVFGLVARATINVPALPVEDPGLDETVHVNPDSGYTAELTYNTKTKEEEVVLTLKTLQITRSSGKTGSTTVTIKLDKIQVYKRTLTSGTFTISGVSKTVARTTKNKQITISLSAKTSEENAVEHPIETIVSVPKKDTGVKQYTNIKRVNSNKEYLVNTAAYQKYGRIEALVEFGDIDDPAKLKEYAQLYVNNMQFDDISLELSVVDLHLLNSDINTLDILDQVRCISYPHGVNRYFIVSEIQIPLDDPTGVQFTLGKKAISGSMSAKSAKVSTDFEEKLTFLPNVANALASAQAEMTEKLNQRTTGYVSIVQENDISQALVISDTEDWTQASALWKFDMNGLGFSNSTTADASYTGLSDTVDGRWYKYGMTMDGTIVADMIKTGVLSDGLGNNYWNLADGTFKLSHNSEISGTGDTLTIGDISAATEDSLNIQTGSINYLNCTDYWEMDTTGRYDNCKWATKVVGRSGRTITSAMKSEALSVSATASNLPNLICKRSLIFKPNPYCIKTIHVEQIQIPTEINTVYTLSFYYKCSGASGTLTPVNIFVEIDNQKKKITSLSSSWNRATYTFTATKASNVVKIGITTAETTSSSSASKPVYISGVLLNLGNTAGDWSASPTDDQLHLYRYIDAIRDGDLGWTDAQINAWTSSLSQETIFNRLVTRVDSQGNTHKTQAIVMDTNGDLYINGSYIKADTLNAKIIKTGILSDAARKNWWNLTTGVLHTDGMLARNAQFTGKIQTVRPSLANSNTPKPSITMTDGSIKFAQYLDYSSNTKKYVTHDCGSIGNLTNVYYKSPDGTATGPLSIKHNYGGVRIEAGALYVRTGYVKVTETYTRPSQSGRWKKVKTERKTVPSNWYRGFTGTVALGTFVRENKKNAYTTTYLHFVNGLFVSGELSTKNTSLYKYNDPTWSYFDNNLKKQKARDLGITKKHVMPQNTDVINGTTRTVTKYKKII